MLYYVFLQCRSCRASVETCRRLTLHVLRRYSSCPSFLSVLYCRTSTLVAKELLADFESTEFIGASRNERIAGMTMYRSCLLLLVGLGLLGRDGGVDALPAIGCQDGSLQWLEVTSGSADCAEVASAIEKLSGVPTYVKCVRKRLRFGSPLRAWGNQELRHNSDDCGACST